jgi:hypothetical protein
MEPLRDFLDAVRQAGFATRDFLGLLHLLIGRRIRLADGTEVSLGLTWRQAAELLKDVRWPTEDVRLLELDPAKLPARDRQRFWYVAIGRAGVHSPEAAASADRLVEPLKKLGYLVGPASGEARKSPRKRR